MFKEYLIELQKLNKSHALFLPFLFLILSIPFPVWINNFFLIVLIFTSIINKNKHFKTINSLIPLGLFFLLSLISLFWSIDFKSSLNTIPRLITLLVIPFIFFSTKPFDINYKDVIVKYYSYSMLILAIVFFARAVVRYLITNDSRVFIYHGENDLDYGLVPKLLNAIHVSVFVALGFFYFISKEVKSNFDYFASVVLFGFILLLSSKNIILVVIVLTLIHFFYFSTSSNKLRLRNLIVFGILVGLIFSFGRIKDRFLYEFQANTKKSLSTNVVEGIPNGVHFVSINEAWNNETFTPNDYFPGTAFRVYQFRIFIEMVAENNVFFNGFGLNASYSKIEEKANQYNLYKGTGGDTGYQNKNFHNQYVQNFAELGIFGFLLLIIILYINLKNALKTKDFVHFAFAILMISLFLTESFLWRQRGVVFFTLFYCLFNAKTSKIKINY